MKPAGRREDKKRADEKKGEENRGNEHLREPPPLPSSLPVLETNSNKIHSSKTNLSSPLSESPTLTNLPQAAFLTSPSLCATDSVGGTNSSVNAFNPHASS